jgi:hypothetical protein
MQLMPVKPAFAAEMVASLMDLLSGAVGGQFLFPPRLEYST